MLFVVEEDVLLVDDICKLQNIAAYSLKFYLRFSLGHFCLQQDSLLIALLQLSR